MPQEDVRNRIDVIDGLRGFAILGVIYHHLYGGIPSVLWKGVWFGNFEISTTIFLKSGYQGVPLFFLLSGFVLSLPFFVKKRSMDTWKDVTSFYKRRARRLLPLFAFNVFICLIFYRVDPFPRDTLKQILALFSMTFPFFHTYRFPGFNGALWTLGLEFWFCILLPIILWSMRKFSAKSVVLTCIFFSLLIRVYNMYWHIEWNLDAYLDNNTFFGQIDVFVLGVAIAYVFAKEQPSRIRGILSAGIGAIIVFIGFTLTIARMPTLLVVAVDQLIIAIGMALGTYGVLTTSSKIIRLPFNNRPIMLLGMMCYSLYVWHGIAVYTLFPFLSPIRLLRYLFLVFVLSGLSYRYIEFGHVRDWRLLLPPKKNRAHPSPSEHLAIISQ